MRIKGVLFLTLILIAAGIASAQDQPNILVIWGDDIGQSNISAYTMGMMGYRTPNIDRIANEGMIFTDYYGEQSCTAGRSSFITGQSVFRTGSQQGRPARRRLGHEQEDPTIAELLKAQGYATGQFGKNHLGDKDEHPADQPRLRRVPRQPLPPQRRGRAGERGLPDRTPTAASENVRSARRHPQLRRRPHRGHRPADQEAHGDRRRRDRRAAIDFIERQHAAGKPFFVWWNGTRMHFRTHVKDELRGISGQDEYSDGMVEHDMHVGSSSTCSTSSASPTTRSSSTPPTTARTTTPGPTRRDALPRREEHQLGRRLARARHGALARQDRGRLVTNEIVHHMDWLPTFVAAAGDADIKEKL